MIKLFFADIDGCLSEPYQSYDLDGFARLRALSTQDGTDGTVPRLGLCSGRSYAYVEAIAQALDLRAPALFESGGGRFDLATARIRWNPALTPEVERELDAVRVFFLEELVAKHTGFSLDYGKRAQAGVVHPDTDVIAAVLPQVRTFVTEQFPDLHVFETPVSIDIVPTALTKVQAIRWASAQEGLTMEEVAFIGDTRGDAGAIGAVGAGFAPANAADAAKEVADIVTQGAVLDGVLEAYAWCIAHNTMQADMV